MTSVGARRFTIFYTVLAVVILVTEKTFGWNDASGRSVGFCLIMAMLFMNKQGILELKERWDK